MCVKWNSCYELVDFSATSRVCHMNTRSRCIKRTQSSVDSINSPQKQKRYSPFSNPHFNRLYRYVLKFQSVGVAIT